MDPFFITGLPMSRTTWLANLFTTGNVFCHHDLLGRVADLDAFIWQLGRELRTGRVGDADSGLLLFHDRVRAAFPRAPWVLVTRDFDDAWSSLCAFVQSGVWSDSISCTWELQQEMRARWEMGRAKLIQWANCMEVPFEALDRTDTIERIWKHCVPGARWDERRVNLLQTFNVRPDQAKCPAKAQFGVVNELKEP